MVACTFPMREGKFQCFLMREGMFQCSLMREGLHASMFDADDHYDVQLCGAVPPGSPCRQAVQRNGAGCGLLQHPGQSTPGAQSTPGGQTTPGGFCILPVLVLYQDSSCEWACPASWSKTTPGAPAAADPPNKCVKILTRTSSKIGMAAATR